MTSCALVHTSLHQALHHTVPLGPSAQLRVARGVCVRAITSLAAHPAASVTDGSAGGTPTNPNAPRLFGVSRRCSSSWVPPERRGRDRLFYDKHRQQNGSRRPWEVNGKPVPFHVNDLKSAPAASQSRGGVAPLGASSSSAASKYVAPIKSYESDLVVVLDMDECLIHSKFPRVNSPGAGYAHQVRRAADNGVKNGHGAVVDAFTIALPEGDLVRVHQRPFLHEFLHHVSERYETHIFTAAVPVYADPVLRKLDPHDTIFTKRWYRDSCTFQDGVYVKDLANIVTASRPERIARPTLDQKLSRMVLVDNNPLSFFSNPSNGILVANFFDDPHDATLLGLIEVLDELDGVGDVRPELEARFGLSSVMDDIKKRLKEGKFNGNKHKETTARHQQRQHQQPSKPIFDLAAAMIPSTPPTAKEQTAQAQQ